MLKNIFNISFKIKTKKRKTTQEIKKKAQKFPIAIFSGFLTGSKNSSFLSKTLTFLSAIIFPIH